VSSPANSPQQYRRTTRDRATTDGREIFFHRNAVVGCDFYDLEAGQPVELAVWTGDSEIGPHASTVRPIGTMAYNPERDLSTR